jgi:hypothetical protein
MIPIIADGPPTPGTPGNRQPLEINHMQTNIELEKIRQRRGRSSHPKTDRIGQTKFAKMCDLKNAPDLDRGVMTTFTLIQAMRAARECLARHGIGEVKIVEAGTKNGVFGIEIGYF